MKNILGKVSALAVASLFAVGSFAGSVGAAGVSSYDRERAADIQRTELRKYKKRNSYYSKYDSIKRNINKNESRISYYEKDVRSKLGGDLSVLLQLKEDCNYRLSNAYWYERSSIRNEINRINNKIGDVRHKIKRNESKIKELKKERERLDRDLAVLMQNHEYDYNCNDNNYNYNNNENY